LSGVGVVVLYDEYFLVIILVWFEYVGLVMLLLFVSDVVIFKDYEVLFVVLCVVFDCSMD